MIIRLFGFPGSGKTTTAPLIAKKNHLPLITISNIFETLFFAGFFIIKHPFVFIKLFWLLIKENSHRGKLLWHKLYLFRMMLAKEGKARFLKKGVIDEGGTQFLHTIFERKIKEKDLKWLKKFYGKQKMIIYYFKTPFKECEKRMIKRGRIPRSFFWEEYLKKWLPIVKYNHLVIAEYLKQNFPIKII